MQALLATTLLGTPPPCAAQAWRQDGFRFSMNAWKPSRRSSKAHVAWKRPRSNLRPSVRVVSAAAFTHSFASCATGVEKEAIFSATFKASSSALPCGTTRDTRPARSASLAVSIAPLSTSSMAFDLPTARISRWVPPTPGIVPSVISGWPNFASSDAMMMSQLMASSQPPPSAKPFTAAITGLRMLETPDQCASMSQCRTAA
mmetsp:Transcript_134396/g.287499  ORF Transcript_134396/g.287499 Transcript_134396/m.287499 type:complete len:202 (-) Transcript_134396:417-1022(-)